MGSENVYKRQPTDTANTSIAWESALWTNDNAIVFYYDTPIFTALDVSSSGLFLSKVMFTGEDPDLKPVTLRVYGGPFIDSDGMENGNTSASTPRLTCRYNGNSTSDIPGEFISVSEVRCPLCETSGARCVSHGSTSDPRYPYIPFAWLLNGTPKSDVDVSISMNGIDFHSAGSQQVLHVYGSPYGLKATHSRDSTLAYKANQETDGKFKLTDIVTVDLVDVQGTPVPNDKAVSYTHLTLPTILLV